MTAASLAGARPRGGWLARAESAERWALPLILLIAGLNFFWQLGSSSYFVDEAFSVLHALPSLHLLVHLVNTTETTPYTYFLFLHQWLYWTGSQAEWVTRFPSAVAGVVLVGAVYWMARAFVRPRVALAAAGLAALSPLIQSYAQETRVYVFLLLVATISVGATVRAAQRPERRGLMLGVGAATMFLAIWLHYISVSVLLPMGIWVATRTELSRRQRGAYLAVCALGVATVMPLLLEQYSTFPNGGAIAGQINWNNVISVAGTPFGTRMGTPVDVRSVTAALLVVFAVGTVLVGSWRARGGARARGGTRAAADGARAAGSGPRAGGRATAWGGMRIAPPAGAPLRARAGGSLAVREPGLLVALGVVGVLGPFLLDLAGKHILITRYTVITAPFLVTVIAAALVELPRVAAAALAAGVLAVSAAGLADNHSPSGFYPPARQAIAYIAPRDRLGQFMLSPGFPLTDTPIFYYDIRLLRPKLHFFGLGDPRVPQVFALYRRIWIIDNPSADTRAAALAAVAPLLRRYHFQAEGVRTFTTSLTLGVMLAVHGGQPVVVAERPPVVVAERPPVVVAERPPVASGLPPQRDERVLSRVDAVDDLPHHLT